MVSDDGKMVQAGEKKVAFSYCPGHCQHLQLDGCVAALCVGEEPRSCSNHSPITIHFLSEHKTEPILTAGIGMQGQRLVAIEVLESWRSAQHRARCFKRLLVVFGPQEIVLDFGAEIRNEFTISVAKIFFAFFVPTLSNGASRATSDRKPKTNDQILPSPILFFPLKN